MRESRLLGTADANYYHVVSRVVDKRFIFGDAEKRHFLRLMRDLLGFTGIRCLTFCVMSNHFHLLLEVPSDETLQSDLSDREFIGRVRHLYRGSRFELIRDTLTRLRKHHGRAADAYREAFVKRMHNLSAFVRELKMAFSKWYNRKTGRDGTLWESRFKSILVEGGIALRTVAAYIDLNPVRAGIVDDPTKYPWCGYAEAKAGSRDARNGLKVALRGFLEEGSPSWRQVHRQYRNLIAPPKNGDPRETSRLELARSVDGGVTLTLPQLLRCRIRYMTDGVALGSRAFLDSVFHQHRSLFGPKRKTGARVMRGGDWQGILCMRDLQKNSVTASP